MKRDKKFEIVISQIRICDLVTEEEKSKAVQDIEEQSEDPEYARETHFNKSKDELQDLFLWHESKLGLNFWVNIDKKINKKNA